MSLIINSFVVSILLLLASTIDTTRIPFIDNTILVPRYLANFTIVHHQSIRQCLCSSLPWFVAFNWFPNSTCQLFVSFPIRYSIQPMMQARLYFPQQVFPNASQCCMPDLGYLFDRMSNATLTVVSVLAPRNLILDSNGYVVTVETQPPRLIRFHAGNLSLISRTNISGADAMGLSFNDHAYYISLHYGPIVVIDSRNLTVLNRINSSLFRGLRGIIFLNQDRTMVVASTETPKLLFFNQTTQNPTNYSYTHQQYLRCPMIQGLFRQNDTSFYGTSRSNNSIYSYTAIPSSPFWNETLFLDATPINNVSGGDYDTIDECGRHWFSMETSDVAVFDSRGVFLGRLIFSVGRILDTLITDNYVMYFSDLNTSGSRIIRVDPHVQC